MNNMKEYLKEILEKFNYPQECGSLLLDCYDAIEADEQKRHTLNAALAAYKNDKNVSYFVLEEHVKKICESFPFHEYTVWLLTYLLMTSRLRELYEQKGIPLSIWRDSINDLRIKTDECWELHGIYGTFVASWFPGFFRLKRFALGRLQYEYSKFQNEEFTCSDGTVLKKGDRVLAVHIPRSEQPLSKENCDSSYEAAAKFFAGDFQSEKVVFTCSSWMLYPRNSEILHAKSNVRRFGEEYELVSVTHNAENEHPDAWRIFGVEPKGGIASLPEDSFLQRAYKSYMLDGGITGRAYGVKLQRK